MPMSKPLTLVTLVMELIYNFNQIYSFWPVGTLK